MNEVKVFNADGGYVRTYSLAIHGEGYIALANQFSKKIKGKTDYTGKPEEDSEDNEEGDKDTQELRGSGFGENGRAGG